MAKRNFKSILSLMISLMLVMSVLSVPFTAGAAVVENSTLVELISDGDFEDYDDGDDVIGTIPDWGEANTSSTVTKKVVSTTDKNGDSTNAMELKLDKASKEKSSLYKNVNSTATGIYILSFDAYIVSLKSNGGFWINLNTDENTGTASNGSVILRNYLHSTKGMSFKDSSSSTTYLPVTEKKVWQNYKIVWDSVNKKAALYLDGAVALPLESIGGNAASLNTIGSVSFYLATGNNVGDSVLFDNISLTYQTVAEYDAVNTLPDTLTYEGTNLTLPTVGEMGSTITWKSSNPDVITEDGAVIPSTEGDTTVTLTATVTDAASQTTATVAPYIINVQKAASQEAIDAANAQADAEAIVLPAYTGQEKLDLPTVGSVYGSEIAWASDSEVINAENGTITLPEEDTVVTLTATVKKGEAEVTKTFTYKFYEKGTIFSEDFSYPSVDDNYDFIKGFNDWTATEDVSSTQVKDTTALIIGEKLVFRQGTEGNPGQYYISKNFSPAKNGVATFTMESSYDPETENFSKGSSGFYVEIAGLTIHHRFNRFRVKSGSDSYGSWTDTADFDVPKDGKYTLQVTMNLDTSKAIVSVNGLSYFSEYDLAAELNSIKVYPQRTQTRLDSSKGTEFAIDNIKITHATSKLQIADLSFVDANGAAVIGRTNGGKLTGVTVAAIDEDIPSAKIFAVVYGSDGKTISSVAVGGKTNLVKDASNVITFDSPALLPEEDAENAVIKLFAWTADGLVPLNISPYVYSKTGQQIKFIMCGDSITCNYNNSKQLEVGIGMKIGDYFDSDKVSVLNIAKSGASTKSFYEERQELQNNLGSINNGDFVFLMFGHNDSHDDDPNKYTEPNTTYKEYLTKMINLARSKGAIPVLLSPIVRCKWNDDGVTINNTLEPYADAMYALSKELNIKYIDTNTATKNLIEGYKKDSEELEAFYLFNKNYEAGLVAAPENDGTHLSDTGASIVAGIIAEAMNENGWLPAGYYIGE